ncbi:Arginyl-tRNA--protein transferase 1 [Coemansia sp. RSA 2611]|nr:Arginyl-tRNA--protein transferase 1 [Coemansia sp. RSA 2610]KAJ2383190.1 Arginyl-tRNA--protein transferase 1 [Coemansia sp. RSA 2611]
MSVASKRDVADDGRSDGEQSRIQVLGMQQRSRCGYCGTPNGSQCFAARSRVLRCADYQALVDRGWRRSGTLLYLTDHSTACCAYYTIRTHALDHQLHASEKKLLRKLHARNLLDPGADASLESKVRAGRRLDVKLEPAGFSEEKFRVFERYQRAVHGDLDATRHGFRNFLCASPLVFDAARAADWLPLGLGSYHQCYYVDGKLAAVGVIDILPACVSSVYLFYDPEFSELSLGTFSSLRELALVHQLHRSVSADIQYYYMGYYIPSCPKMTYKGRWRPADLLDLVTLAWIPIDRCLERIRRHPVFCTFDPLVADRGIVRDTRTDTLNWAPVIDPCTLSPDDRRRTLQLVFWIGSRTPVPASSLVHITEEIERVVLQTGASLGLQLASRVMLSL